MKSLLCKGAVNNLADLPPGRVPAWAECAVRVAGDNAVGESSLNEAEECVPRQHIAEVTRWRTVIGPAHCQHHDLTQLAASDVAAWAERAVGVASYQIVVVCGLHERIESICGLH